MNYNTLRERERALLTDKKKMGTKGDGWARPSTASDWLGERERTNFRQEDERTSISGAVWGDWGGKVRTPPPLFS